MERAHARREADEISITDRHAIGARRTGNINVTHWPALRVRRSADRGLTRKEAP